MKPLGFKNYGSIGHLPNSKLGPSDSHLNEGQVRILTEKKRDKHDEIFVFEKYDGSNVGIAKKNGEILALTRSGYLAKTSNYKQHHKFHDWVNNNIILFDDLLNEGERITGEWMYQAHGMAYIIKDEPILFFDIFDVANNRRSISELEEITSIYGLYMPRKLHSGDAIKTTELFDELNKKTDYIKSVDNPEGMVYRVERKGRFDYLGKWVRNDYPTGKYIIETKEEIINKVS